MLLNRNYYLLLLFLFVAIYACGEPDMKPDRSLSEEIQNLENLRVITTGEDSFNTVHFEREIEFGHSDDIIIGKLGSITVDKYGRVYMGDTQQQKIYIFDRVGVYVASLGRHGRGPGEFQFVGYLTVIEDLLIAFDPPQFRLNLFFGSDFTRVETIPFTITNQQDFEELREYELGFMHPVSKNRFLGVFSTPMIFSDPSHPNYNLNDRTRLFYLIDDTGTIISDKLFEQSDLRALSASVNNEYRFTLFEFLGQMLISVSHDHKIYQAWSEDFLIRTYDEDGLYLYSFYYPFQKREFTQQDAIHQQEHEYEGDEAVLEYRMSVIRHAPEEDIPEYWPALNDLLVDDEGRIWVSTIIDDDEEYEWWVLDNSGSVLARFHWPIDEPIEVVKNGSIYTRETDEETGLERVVKYRIEMGS